MELPYRLIILSLLLIGFYCFKSSGLIIQPPRIISPHTPADFGLDYKPLQLITEDSLKIDAWFIPVELVEANPDKSRYSGTKKPTIIICHGFHDDKGSCMNICCFLHSAGYNVLMFDFRAHGKSEGKYCSLGHHEYKDFESAILWLSERGFTPIGAIGVSMGGTTAFITQARSKKLRAVVSDGAYLSFSSAVTSFARANFKAPKYPFIPPAIWTAALRLKFNPYRLNLTNIMPKISPRPVFIIHGALDRAVRPKDAYALFEHAKEPKELWIVEGAQHCGAYNTAKDEYEQRVISFFDSYLRVEDSIIHDNLSNKVSNVSDFSSKVSSQL